MTYIVYMYVCVCFTFYKINDLHSCMFIPYIFYNLFVHRSKLPMFALFFFKNENVWLTSIFVLLGLRRCRCRGFEPRMCLDKSSDTSPKCKAKSDLCSRRSKKKKTMTVTTISSHFFFCKFLILNDCHEKNPAPRATLKRK